MKIKHFVKAFARVRASEIEILVEPYQTIHYNMITIMYDRLIIRKVDEHIIVGLCIDRGLFGTIKDYTIEINPIKVKVL